MTRHVRTFCRICETACGLVAEVDDEQLVGITPDRDHPVTAGYACHKGLALVDLHRDPDRLDHPMRRVGDRWERASWDQAFEEIGGKLRELIDRHGPDAVGLYYGNPAAFNSLGMSSAETLTRGLGITRSFNSGTQDCANKFAASEAMYGSIDMHPIPDLANTDLCLIIGSNPRVSQGSFFTAPNVMNQLRQARARGARVVFVNPRRIETPERGIGETILIRPDTDLYFLAALLREIDHLDGFDEQVLSDHGRNVEELRAFIADYDAESTAPVTGIPAAVTRELAATWVAAGAASAHASTGLNMGRQGTLAYWLVEMLTFATGNLDRAGGNLRLDDIFSSKPGADPASMYEESEWGILRRGAKPGTLLPDYIVESASPIRAMIVIAGNPLLSIGGGERLREAFEHLDLLVSIDIYRSATGELADWLLPTTDMLERDDINPIGFGIAERPYVQYTEPVVEPRAERRSEWWICNRILQAAGRPSVLDAPDPDPWAFWRRVLAESEVDFDAMRRDGEIVLLPEPRPNTFFETQIRTPDKRVDCCPPTFADALDGARSIFVELAEEEPTLKLISRRDAWMMNSWLQNLSRMHKGKRTVNPLYMHPSDAEARGLADGSPARASNDHGSIDVVVGIDEALLPGVVAMAHGWGNERSTGLRVASAAAGANCNALLPTGPDSFERLSNQAHMTGVPVVVEALPRTSPTTT